LKKDPQQVAAGLLDEKRCALPTVTHDLHDRECAGYHQYTYKEENARVPVSTEKY
jgi:hypothetical protein